MKHLVKIHHSVFYDGRTIRHVPRYAKAFKIWYTEIIPKAGEFVDGYEVDCICHETKEDEIPVHVHLKTKQVDDCHETIEDQCRVWEELGFTWHESK